ncbi:zinc-finger domain-containing protein [Neisseria sp. 23W00296]|uniref:zinc-finger domain-containing protein n=1 Tax=unclassified Neisseria TaxID=2623750 RepID=UPI00055C3220|nr:MULTISPECIES: zinc-finger domain-containing protein [unclassified Neisseria]ASP18427.1 zinc-finger domain-containing protein [Neisseria sp. KEM232]
MNTTPHYDTVVIKPHELPLHCSGPRHETWNGHPRVFLAIQSNSEIECPYCGTIYKLDGEIGHHHS